jgi:hypothetical protein
LSWIFPRRILKHHSLGWDSWLLAD